MSNPGGFQRPNTTSVPDDLFALLPSMSEAELKVTLYLIRQTYGWHREWSEKQYSSMEKICEKTGLSDNSARTGLKAAMDRNTVERRPDGRTFQYRIIVASDASNPSKSEGSTRATAKPKTAKFEVSDPNPSKFEGSDFEGLDPAKSEGQSGLYKEETPNTGTNTTASPADAGDAQARVAAPRPATQPPAAELAATTPQRALFAAVCAAGGWSPKDLTRGSREQLGQLVASLLTTPEAERPDADQLRATYQTELAALSGRLGRRVQGLTPVQFREAIGRWIAANRQEAADRQRLAEKALREAEDAARKRQERAAAEAAGPGLAHEGHEAWGRIARELRSRMSPATWDSWLAAAQPLALQDGVLTIQVASSYAVDWITQRLAAPLAALAEELGLEDLRFVPQELAREVRAA